jgi:hypothetical protein
MPTSVASFPQTVKSSSNSLIAFRAETPNSRSTSFDTSRSSFEPESLGPTLIAGVSNNQGTVHLRGVQRFMQSDSRWSGTEYRFASNIFGNPYKGQTIGQVGCTMTALANGLSAVVGRTVTPKEINEKTTTKSFESAYGVKLETLYGGKLKPAKDRIAVEFDSKGNISGDSSSGVLQKIRQSLQNGKPVIVGLTSSTGKSTTGGYDRHSVIAYGLSADGKILVYDPARKAGTSGLASAQTLDATMQYWKETHIDFANAISKK